MSEFQNRCDVCGQPIDDFADVCDKHALSRDELIELTVRIDRARDAYYREIFVGDRAVENPARYVSVPKEEA